METFINESLLPSRNIFPSNSVRNEIPRGREQQGVSSGTRGTQYRIVPALLQQTGCRPFPCHSCRVILGRVARKTRRDASVAKLFCPRAREKFSLPPGAIIVPLRVRNLVICSFHCSLSRPGRKIGGDGLLTCREDLQSIRQRSVPG